MKTIGEYGSSYSRDSIVTYPENMSPLCPPCCLPVVLNKGKQQGGQTTKHTHITASPDDAVQAMYGDDGYRWNFLQPMLHVVTLQNPFQTAGRPYNSMGTADAGAHTKNAPRTYPTRTQTGHTGRGQ